MSRPSVEVVTTLGELQRLEAELVDLFARDQSATPFQSPAWWLSWLECFAPSAELRVVLVRTGERLSACLPLWIYAEPTQRSLVWVGDGITDYLDALVDRSLPCAFDVISAALRDIEREVDCVRLCELPADSPNLELWSGMGRGQLETCSACPALELGREARDLERTLPRWLSRNIRQTEQRLRSSGAVEWQLATAADAPAQLQVFSGLHAARWRARGQPGVLAEPAVQAFHRAVVPRLLASGLLELEVAYLEGRPLAASYVLTRSQAYLYLFGYDPSAPRLSLGSWLIWRSITRAVERGRARYDFLRGREDYKYQWGATDRWTRRFVSRQAALAGGGPNSCSLTRKE